MAWFRLKAPEVRPEVMEFHRKQILVDLHVDVIIQRRLFGYNIQKKHEPWKRRQPLIWHADIPRMVEGGYTLAALGLHYLQKESPKGWSEVRKQKDIAKSIADKDPSTVWVETAADIEQAHEQGLLAMMPGVEGAHILNGNLEHLQEAREWGTLYLTLSHFCKNQAATPGIGRGSNPHDGLTDWGRDLIRALNELQIVVDVAHVNPAGVLDICEATTQPVIASHTCAMGFYNTRRGIPDDGLRAIAETGGVVGIIFSPHFLCGKLNASTSCIVDQARYLADLIGPEHIAFGSDFDGWIPSIPNDMRDCRDMPMLTQQLLDAGFSHDEVAGILGQNFLRVLRTVRG